MSYAELQKRQLSTDMALITCRNWELTCGARLQTEHTVVVDTARPSLQVHRYQNLEVQKSYFSLPKIRGPGPRWPVGPSFQVDKQLDTSLWCCVRASLYINSLLMTLAQHITLFLYPK